MPEKGGQQAALAPRQKKRVQASARLLEHGLALMGRGGIHQTRVEEITRAAGVGKGSFFTYFGSKEAFVARLVERVLLDLGRRVRPVGLGSADAEALVSGVGAVHLRYFQLRPESASLLCQAAGLADGDDPAAAEVRRLLLEHVEATAQKLAPAAAALGWPAEGARELALAMLALSCGLFWFGGGLGIGADTPASLLDRLGRVLARGLAAPG